MKLKYTFLSVGMTALALTACSNSKQEQEKLKSRVIAKHDTLMVQMDHLMAKKAQLDSLDYPALKQADATLDTLKLHLSADSIKMKLAKADEAMMDWMHQFEPDFTGKTEDQIISYLKEQENKIDSVEAMFKKSITAADSLLKK